MTLTQEPPGVVLDRLSTSGAMTMVSEQVVSQVHAMTTVPPAPEPVIPADLLGRVATTLAHQNGIHPQLALLGACAALNAAAGASLRVCGPGEIETIPALHLLLVGRKSSGLLATIRHLFHPLLQQARVRAGLSKAMTLKNEVAQMKAVEKKFADAGALRLQADLDKRKAEAPWAYGTKDPSSWQPLSEPEIKEKQREAAKAKAAAWEELVELQLNKLPLFLVEGAAPAEFLRIGAQSPDKAVFNLDLNGSTWSGFLAEKPAKQLPIARKLVAGWEGSTCVQGGDFDPPAAISTLALVSPELFASIWHNDRIVETGLRPAYLIAMTDIEFEPVPKPDADTAVMEEVANLLLKVLRKRVMNEVTRHKLSPQAEVVYHEFVREVSRRPELLAPGEECIWSHAPDSALRLASLMHAGSQYEAPEVIPAAAMEQAIGLVKWLAGRVRIPAEGKVGHAGSEDVVEEEILALVVRLRRRGPLSQRDLFRSFHDQDYTRLTPVLEQAIREGLVVRQDDSLLVAAA